MKWQYKAGRTNVADPLSRLPASDLQLASIKLLAVATRFRGTKVPQTNEVLQGDIPSVWKRWQPANSAPPTSPAVPAASEDSAVPAAPAVPAANRKPRKKRAANSSVVADVDKTSSTVGRNQLLVPLQPFQKAASARRIQVVNTTRTVVRTVLPNRHIEAICILNITQAIE